MLVIDVFRNKFWFLNSLTKAERLDRDLIEAVLLYNKIYQELFKKVPDIDYVSVAPKNMWLPTCELLLSK